METYMKSKQEFSKQEEYKEYLKFYFAGIAMQGIIANAPNGQLSNSKQGVSLSIQWADELLKQLEA